jgi:hypothetical protein
MPLDELIQHVRDVLTRADSLFGSPDPAAPIGHTTEQLGGAAQAVRAQQVRVSDMSGAALTDYSDFALERGAALERLSAVEARLNRHLQDAADAEISGAATSRSALAATDAQTEHFRHVADTPAGRRSLIAALLTEIAHQQEAARQHQERAAEFAAQVLRLGYE